MSLTTFHFKTNSPMGAQTGTSTFAVSTPWALKGKMTMASILKLQRRLCHAWCQA